MRATRVVLTVFGTAGAAACAEAGSKSEISDGAAVEPAGAKSSNEARAQKTTKHLVSWNRYIFHPRVKLAKEPSREVLHLLSGPATVSRIFPET